MASSTTDQVSEEFAEGTMVWVNQNYLKNSDWQNLINPDGQYVTGSYIHTFTVHGTARAGIVEEEIWWSQQSNVCAHIIAPVPLPRSAVHSYPKESDELMATLFLEDLLITETNFPLQVLPCHIPFFWSVRTGKDDSYGYLCSMH